jgi:hypothetical protein
VTYLVQSHFDVARKNAEESKLLPLLAPDAKQNCLEFFIDDLEIPNFVILDSELILSTRVKNLSFPIQIMGDDGFIFIQIEGKVFLNRSKYWRFPSLSLNRLYGWCDSLDLAIDKLKLGI